MTYEEALKLVHQGKYAEADELIVEALEKQIPAKPIDNVEERWFYCPTCNDLLVPYYRGTPHHCECGQKIDWSDEE